jgi:hypothetical protein
LSANQDRCQQVEHLQISAFQGVGSMTWICAILETRTALYGYGRFNARLAFGVIYFTHSTSAPIHSHEE